MMQFVYHTAQGDSSIIRVSAPSGEGQKAEAVRSPFRYSRYKGSLIIKIFKLFESSESHFLKSKHLTKVDS